MVILRSTLKSILEDVLVEFLPEKSAGEITDLSDAMIERLSMELDIYDEDEDEDEFFGQDEDE